MVEYEVNKGVSKTELSIKLREITQFDEFRYRMIKENRIAGIVSCERSQVNDSTVYTYDITGMQSAAMRFEGKKFTRNEIQKLYIDVLSIVLKSEEYFLDKNCFLLSEELIQYEEISKSYQLLYCPEHSEEIKGQLAAFTEYVLNHTDYSDQPAVALIYEVFQMMRDDHTTILEILTYIKEGKKPGKINGGQLVQPNAMQMERGCEPQPFIMPQASLAPSQPSSMPKQQIPQKNPFALKTEEEDGKTEAGFSTKKVLYCMGIVAAGIGIFLALYLSGVLFMNHTNRLDTSRTGGTILLDTVIVLYACYKVYGREEATGKKKEARPEKKKETKNSKKPPKLNPQKQELPRKPVMPSQPVNQPPKPAMPKQLQETEGKKPVYRLIAKKGSNAQQFLLYKSPYVVGKSHEQVDGVIYSDAVSKVHAEFIEEQGRLYVVDMSSTNGTYVNEKKIASNQRIAVRGGDRIQIADKEYLLSS